MASKNLRLFRPFFADSVFRRSLFNKVNGSKGGQSLPNLLHFDGYKWSVTLEAKWFEKTIKNGDFFAFLQLFEGNFREINDFKAVNWSNFK